MCNILKKRGRGLHALVFVIFVIPTFFTKQNMLNNLVEGEIIEQVSERDDDTIVSWVYEGANVRYFLDQ